MLTSTITRTLVAAGCAWALAACQPADQTSTDATDTDTGAEAVKIAASVDTDRIRTASSGAEWLTYGAGYDEQRHSSLDQINQSNVKDLGVAWTYDLATARGVESTPIVVDGVMYVTSAWSVVYALDAATGEELWVYDPQVDRAVGVKACCDVVNRGVAVYEGKILVGVIDGRLEALDATTGERLWSTVTVDQSLPYTITGAPRVANGMVMIGNGGAELGVRGYLSAYNVDNGQLEWRFYTAPNPDKQPDGAASDEVFARFANDSWGDTGDWKTQGGGGTVWDSIVYDTANNQIVFGVGNSSPWNWKRRDPSGKDNLFVSSIVAVDADTGAYKWHFQTTPSDTWDYTATQHIMLADLPLGEDGADRRVVMQAPKNGFFYVLDAKTGAFISGDNFVPVNWASGLDDNGRPIEVAEARDQTSPYLQVPGPLGAHNWQPMAYDPGLGLVYIPAQEIPQAYVEDPNLPGKPAKWNTGVDFAAGLDVELPPGIAKALRATLKGRLIAWDPVAQEARWTVEHNNAWNGGILSTAGGVVFQGRLDGTFAAYDAATGDRLWASDVKSGAASGPGTFEIDGTQYVTITTGWGSALALTTGFALDEVVAPVVGKVVTFKLGGTGTVPDHDLVEIERTPQDVRFGDAAMEAEGLKHFSRNCLVCHGVAAISSGVLPDLRWSPISGDADAWREVVSDGILAENGMVAFSDVLTADEIESVRAYIVAQAHLGAANDAAETP